MLIPEIEIRERLNDEIIGEVVIGCGVDQCLAYFGGAGESGGHIHAFTHHSVIEMLA